MKFRRILRRRRNSPYPCTCPASRTALPTAPRSESLAASGKATQFSIISPLIRPDPVIDLGILIKIELKKTNSKKDISPNIQLMNVAKFELTEGDCEINCIRVIN